MLNIFIFVLLLISNLAQSAVIDVVIPCHKKDARTLELAIAGIKKHGKNVRRIIVVSAQRLTTSAEWFPESRYPFGKADIPPLLFRHNPRAMREYVDYPLNKLGWMYQQLLKLYAPLVIPDISPNVLLLDADTIFLRDVNFIDDEGHALYNVGTEYFKPYFMHMQRLLPGLKKVYEQHSGVCHHMLVQRHVIEDLFRQIKAVHKCEPWQALCLCIDPKEIYRACFSEYEIYFNFIFSGNYAVKLRPLAFENKKFTPNYQQELQEWYEQGYVYVSCHSWMA